MMLDDKICPRPELMKRLACLPRPWVFTNGVFDIVHKGHVHYLEQARSLGGSLVVGLNTDASVRLLGKGDDRPLNTEMDRAAVLAALSSVSLVTFFDDKTPLELIREVAPDIYVKGGDYDMDVLPEARWVRDSGGQALAIEFTPGYSTSSLLKRARGAGLNGRSVRRAVFLDRDGVINLDTGYVGRWSDFQFLPGAVEGLKRLQDAGYALVIVTNQSGLARGYFDEKDYLDLNAHMTAALRAQGVVLEGIYHCPHHPEGIVGKWAVACGCRKPLPGLILQAATELGIALSDSILIGDRLSDIQAARAAQMQAAYLIVQEGGQWAPDARVPVDGAFPNLSACALALTGRT